MPALQPPAKPRLTSERRIERRLSRPSSLGARLSTEALSTRTTRRRSGGQSRASRDSTHRRVSAPPSWSTTTTPTRGVTPLLPAGGVGLFVEFPEIPKSPLQQPQ